MHAVGDALYATLDATRHRGDQEADLEVDLDPSDMEQALEAALMDIDPDEMRTPALPSRSLLSAFQAPEILLGVSDADSEEEDLVSLHSRADGTASMSGLDVVERGLEAQLLSLDSMERHAESWKDVRPPLAPQEAAGGRTSRVTSEQGSGRGATRKSPRRSPRKTPRTPKDSPDHNRLIAGVQAAGQRVRDALAKAEDYKVILAVTPRTTPRKHSPRKQGESHQTEPLSHGNATTEYVTAELESEALLLQARIADAASYAERLTNQMHTQRNEVWEQQNSESMSDATEERHNSTASGMRHSNATISIESVDNEADRGGQPRHLYSWSNFGQTSMR